MPASLLASDAVGFADGAGGHLYALPSGAPAVGDLDVLCVNSDTTVSTPSGFSLATSHVGNQGAYLFYRLALGGEASTVTITTAGNNNTALGWSRWDGVDALDVSAQASTESVGLSTPAVNTGTLSATDELVVAMGAIANLSAVPTSPVWSAGYTGLTDVNQGGAATNAVHQFTGYRLDAGTAAQTPNVSWTNSAFSRYILVAAFTSTAATGVGVDDTATAGDTVGTAASATVTDTGTETESHSVTVAVTTSDAGTALDTVTVSTATVAPDRICLGPLSLGWTLGPVSPGWSVRLADQCC